MQELTKTAATNPCAGNAGDGATESIRRIDQSVDYMTQHLDRPLQVATLAAQVNISPSHFFALFKRRIGSAPIDYFTRMRMQRACRLLETTSLSVKEIAAKLGYDDPFYFSRVFKSVNRVAPSDYRSALRLGSDRSSDGNEAAGFASEPQTESIPTSLQFA